MSIGSTLRAVTEGTESATEDMSGSETQSHEADRHQHGPPRSTRQFGALRKWALARGLIQHEDGLIHHRMISYFHAQAFLMAAAGIIVRQSSLPGYRSSAVWPLILGMIAVIAIFLSAAADGAIKAARDQIDHVKWWWDTNASDDRFPQICGKTTAGFDILKFIQYLRIAWFGIAFLSVAVSAIRVYE